MKVLSLILLAFLSLVLTVSGQAQRTATAIPTVANGFVIAATVTDGGAGYTGVPRVTISGGGGSGAIAIATVFNGAVDRVIVQNAGFGYVGTPIVVIDPPPSPKPPFSDGLSAYYPFDGNAKDESGNGNDGTIFGNPTLAEDRFGSPNESYAFHAGSDSIVVRNVPLDIASGAKTTVSLWMLWDGTFYSPNDRAAFLVEFSHNYFLFFQGYGPGRLGFGTGLGDLWGINYDSSFSHRWIHVVAIFNNGDTRQSALFIDGVKVDCNMTMGGQNSQGSYTSNVSPKVTISGLDPDASSTRYRFSGRLDDVRIYNRALSADEIRDLYRYESPERPWITIEVKSVQLTLNVRPTKRYQLQASLDFSTWVNLSVPFVATASQVIQEVDAIQVGRFFRLFEVQ